MMGKQLKWFKLLRQPDDLHFVFHKPQGGQIAIALASAPVGIDIPLDDILIELTQDAVNIVHMEIGEIVLEEELYVDPGDDPDRWKAP